MIGKLNKGPLTAVSAENRDFDRVSDRNSSRTQRQQLTRRHTHTGTHAHSTHSLNIRQEIVGSHGMNVSRLLCCLPSVLGGRPPRRPCVSLLRVSGEARMRGREDACFLLVPEHQVRVDDSASGARLLGWLADCRTRRVETTPT